MKALFFKRIFIVTMVAMALVSLAFLLVRKEAAPMVSGLEGLLILYCGAAFLWAQSQRIDSVVIVRTGIGLYVVLSCAYVIMYKHANALDFLLIYKSYIYLFFLTFLVDKRLMTAKSVLNFYTFLLGVFFVKYLLALVLHTDDRPVVYRSRARRRSGT